MSAAGKAYNWLAKELTRLIEVAHLNQQLITSKVKQVYAHIVRGSDGVLSSCDGVCLGEQYEHVSLPAGLWWWATSRSLHYLILYILILYYGWAQINQSNVLNARSWGQINFVSHQRFCPLGESTPSIQFNFHFAFKLWEKALWLSRGGSGGTRSPAAKDQGQKGM